ncbi:Thrombospondin type-1 domain-containing protein 4 [Pteropus alecto]|uniref:Thrombospondin type-1 domain-containing protein 4 n=1 Tax=Pteropus alecto TaxID=9402 RepID=L5JYE9_PTEAL|nr:Thrombospondin type-1 domain-containing protein 4 [Pteropus alecto]
MYVWGFLLPECLGAASVFHLQCTWDALQCARASIGCDDYLGSDKVVDKCGVCGGDNTGCQVVSGVFKHALTSLGYHRVVEIPQGATKINITEMHKSNNYLVPSPVMTDVPEPCASGSSREQKALYPPGFPVSPQDEAHERFWSIVGAGRYQGSYALKLCRDLRFTSSSMK